MKLPKQCKRCYTVNVTLQNAELIISFQTWSKFHLFYTGKLPRTYTRTQLGDKRTAGAVSLSGFQTAKSGGSGDEIGSRREKKPGF